MSLSTIITRYNTEASDFVPASLSRIDALQDYLVTEQNGLPRVEIMIGLFKTLIMEQTKGDDDRLRYKVVIVEADPLSDPVIEEQYIMVDIDFKKQLKLYEDLQRLFKKHATTVITTNIS